VTTTPVVALSVEILSLIPEALLDTTDVPVITGLVRDLFVRVSVVALPTKVSVPVGRVSVPLLLMVVITGKVSTGPVYVALPDTVPVTVGLVMVGVVRVLLVRVSVVVLPTSVWVELGKVWV